VGNAAIPSDKILEVYIADGTPIAIAAARVAFEARATGFGASMTFNGTVVVARPGDTAEAVERAYWLARGCVPRASYRSTKSGRDRSRGLRIVEADHG
jgi:hypothetical protein